MSLHKLGRIIAGIGIVGAMGAIAYQYLFRPWADRWGATLDEVYGHLPGDELIPHPKGQYTHAIPFVAPAPSIWPWLMQIGQSRGGFYSYDWLENLLGLDIHSVNQIVPQFQNLAIGDLVRMHPIGGSEVAILEPERDLVLYTDPDTQSGRPSKITGVPGADPLDFVSTWSFYLRPLDSRSTRLISRSRGDWNSNRESAIAYGIFLPFVTFIMSQKMLRGIKARVEKTQ